LRRGGGLKPVRRHSVGPRPRLHRHDRHRPLGQHQPRARLSLRVRAGAWIGARHRRPGARKPDRPDLVGGHDAGASRRDRSRGRDRLRDRARAVGQEGAHPRPRRRGRHGNLRQGDRGRAWL
ncbi:MAG: D-malate dehydrogenase [decarboxylating], partial [uncultured Microvirga sp.]